MRAQITEALQEVGEYRVHLKALTNQMRRTEFELNESLATMGTIYLQLQLFNAKEIDGSRARRLSKDIDEQANRLDDLLAAMDKVYNK